LSYKMYSKCTLIIYIYIDIPTHEFLNKIGSYKILDTTPLN